MDHILIIVVPLVGGYLLDLALGDPASWPHPVVWFGRAIAAGERRLNQGTNRARFCRGALLVAFLLGGTWAATFVLVRGAAALHPWLGVTAATVVVFYGLANRTLIAEGRAVFAALDADLSAGRSRLARIVGRDTVTLTPQQVRTAVFETMSENLSDGVVAPLFWYGIGGAPAMLAYKMVNTLDSMIGHHDERHEWFGKVAARVDDVANYLPARLTAALLALASGSARAWRFVWRYGRAHASPNSGYPEAALAGALDVRFGGPLRYDGEWVEKPYIGENPREIRSAEIARVARLNHVVTLCSVALAATAQVTLRR